MAILSDLTPRELQILQLVVAGRTNKAIAAEIYICEKTVEFHLNKLYTKLGVRTRNLASIWAIRQGLEMETEQISS
jgi:DNA-binding NarL/FixJ family response regulator